MLQHKSSTLSHPWNKPRESKIQAKPLWQIRLCVCPCLRLNLLSIAGRARLLILRLEESERLQELGEKLLVLMFKLHVHTAHVDLLLRWMPPTRNKLRLYLQVKDTMPRRTDQQEWIVDHWRLKNFRFCSPALVNAISARRNSLCDASNLEGSFTSLPSLTRLSALCTLPGIHQGQQRHLVLRRNIIKYQYISILGSEAKKTIKDSLLTLP